MTRVPSLAETWLVEDGLAALDGLCPRCRAAFVRTLSRFSQGPREAFREIYRLSRAIRVQHVLAGRLDHARTCDDWEVLRIMDTLKAMILMAGSAPRHGLAGRPT